MKPWGLRKRVTEKQREFARILVTNKGNITNTQCAKEAGYQGNNHTLKVKASILQNPIKSPLVVKYIDELREKNFEDNKLAINKVLEEFHYMLQQAKESLKEEMKKGKYKKVVRIVGKFKEVFSMLGYTDSGITVYLAEETRPYHTGHYKIGRTNSDVQSRSTGRTDNPFGLNYISTFKYIPSNGFDLEKTLHDFFKHYSTYNHKYDTSASEWFSVKNRKTMITNFRKVGTCLLYKNELLHTYKYYGEAGYF